MVVPLHRQTVIARHRWLLLLPMLLVSVALGLLMGLPMLRPARPAPDIVQAYEAAKRGEWEIAAEEARRYVLAQPEDPIGHFLLGQAYLYGPRLQLTIAAGEMETALRLHERTGSLGAWAGTLDSTEFVYRVYKIRAVVELRIVREAISYELPVNFIRRHLLAGLEQVRMGLQVKPGDPEIKEMEDALTRILQDLRLPPPPLPAENTARVNI